MKASLFRYAETQGETESGIKFDTNRSAVGREQERKMQRETKRWKNKERGANKERQKQTRRERENASIEGQCFGPLFGQRGLMRTVSSGCSGDER